MKRMLIPAVGVFLLAACADAPQDPAASAESPSPSAAEIVPLPSSTMGLLAVLRGTLGGGMVEGRPCVWLIQPGSGPVNTLWEPGYRTNKDLDLLDADGKVIARLGDSITGGGGILPSGGEQQKECAQPGITKTVELNGVATTGA